MEREKHLINEIKKYVNDYVNVFICFPKEDIDF